MEITNIKLLQVLEGLDGNPFKEVKPGLDEECFLLRDRINDQRVLVPYDNDKTTNEMGVKFLWHNDGGTLKYLGAYPAETGLYINIGTPTCSNR